MIFLWEDTLLKGRRAIVLSKKDNVAVAQEEIEKGAVVTVKVEQESRNFQAIERIPFGFKMALTDIEEGQGVFKYGEMIGLASKPIMKGELVHVHNLAGTRGRGDLAGPGKK
jgi:altronate dehydratase small subunit